MRTSNESWGKDTRLYRSRFKEPPEEAATAFVSSLHEDVRLIDDDIDQTEAHVIMLHRAGLISAKDVASLLTALEKVRRSVMRKKPAGYEDIHELVEHQVIEMTGLSVGGRIQTARSRNDQIATDIRMSVRRGLNSLSEKLLALVEALLKLAEKNVETPIVLYTHMQHAQVGTFGHYLLAHVDSLLRGEERVRAAYSHANQSPLGASVCGGSRFRVNRTMTSRLLGFQGIVENTLDAVSSRDFLVEVVGSLAIIMVDLSRMAEDLILWSTEEFGYIELSDKYASPSSAMPHKKNPSVLELIRARAARVFSCLTQLLTVTKALPTGYSLDLQETKAPIWEGLDRTEASLSMMAGVVSTMKVNTRKMAEKAAGSLAIALDMAEALAAETGLSFREAHLLVGRLVSDMYERSVPFNSLSVQQVKAEAKRILGKSVSVDTRLLIQVSNLRDILKQRKTRGGPAPSQTRAMLQTRKTTLNRCRKRLRAEIRAIQGSRSRLSKMVKQFSMID
ncbi:MAG: argininosuccinate lyase [Aigarchaeota archaeon]|nr:argininosuccinate lyase [Aigarchaeota archaeon]MDH5702663.1 argininosuccinate lyase [Aigarchaeota archaeon]